jgi:uncharacterized protein (TIGR02466 family)
VNEFHYFSSPVYREEIPDWVPLVSSGVQKYFDQQKNWEKENNINYAVRQTQNAVNDPDLQFLEFYFRDKAIEILKSQGYSLNGFEFYVSGMWGQEMQKHGSHEPHVHPHSQLCGLYFIDVSKGGSFPIFSDPRPGKLMCDYFPVVDGNVYPSTPKIYFDNVLAGTFMFFNAWLPHQFSVNQSEQPTRFIHFILSHRLQGTTCSM